MEEFPRIPSSITCLKLTGSHYDVGYELGKCMKKEICEYLKDMEEHFNILKQYTNSTEGKQTYQTFLNAVTSHYPLYRRELEGTADGAGVDFEKLFLFNLEPELTALYGNNSTVEAASSTVGSQIYPQSNGCTDIYVRDSETDTFVLGHSEDGIPEMDNACVWLDVDITDTRRGETVKERFLSFTRAGSMPGNMFNIMANDLMNGANNVYQKSINPAGIPRRFFMRAILSANSYLDVINIIEKPPGIASGYNINLIHPGSGVGLTCTCIEIAGHPDGEQHFINPCEDFFTHTNLYNYLTMPHYQEESSVQRQRTVDSWKQKCKLVTKSDVIRILSNQENSEFPVFRTGKYPDYLTTSCIALFDLNTMKLDIYRDKPETTDPTLTINIREFR
ncbi:beta-alanyl-dopamine/carcinine hydrolase-like isoform X2 [Argopecten irradians]|uniref:beta-alanyl-dopamine/carcinine hydrolase-like isoform X2 n=1 Tax=Argopecten irradians TaxID=31199 RepID=UPI0037212C49